MEYLINVNKNRALGLVAREPPRHLDLATRQDFGAGRRMPGRGAGSGAAEGGRAAVVERMPQSLLRGAPGEPRGKVPRRRVGTRIRRRSSMAEGKKE